MKKKSLVQLYRESEGLTRSALARLSGISARTISRIESGENTVSEISKRKIVEGFNSSPDARREYTYEFLFPEDDPEDSENLKAAISQSISIIIDPEQTDKEKITDLLLTLSELYRAIGGDGLVILESGVQEFGWEEMLT